MLLAADQRVIGVAVSTVVSLHEEHMVQQRSTGYDEVQLVPMFGSGMWLGEEESVGGAELK